MRFSRSILVAAVAILGPVLGHSAPLNPSTSLSIDGYNFDNFSCSVSKGGIFATPSKCSEIKVNTITQPGIGIRFSSGFTAFPLSFDDAVLSYDVSSKAGIDQIGLDFDGNFYGYAISSVTEKVYSGSTEVGFATVSCGAFIGCTQSDTISLNGTYHNLYVEKDINVSSFLGYAETSVIDQTFALAPEPSSIALLGGGLLAISMGLRRRYQRAANKA